MKKINNILVVNVNWLGDVVFSSPIFPALKEMYPNAHISCLAPPRVHPVLESIPGIDEILCYDEKGKHKSFIGKIKLIFHLRKYKFDIAFLLHGSLTRALIVYLAGIPCRVGYPTKGRGKYLTHIVNPILDIKNLHRSDYYINVVESYGVTFRDRSTCLIASETALEEINSLLREQNMTNRDFLIGVNPGGNWELKRWPSDRFSLLIDQLISRTGAKVILTGAMKDVSLSKGISSNVGSQVLNLTGKLSLKQLIALYKKMDVVISADSGPIHLASGIGTHVIGLFGPTKAAVTGPRGTGTSDLLQYDIGCNREACYHLACKDNICMQAVTVNDVLNAVQKIKKTNNIHKKAA